MGLSSDQASNSGNSIEFLPPPNSSPPSPNKTQQKPQEPEKLKCPRCHSTNTKFCYFNNYNKSQPRHFCKSCRRYWTAGGTLRDIPIGGGRKNKRPKAATTTTFQMNFQPQNQSKEQISTTTTTHDHDDHKLQFPSPSFLPCSISGSGYVSDLYGESSGLEEIAMEGVEPCLSSLDDQPWMYMESTVNGSWVWDDIDDKLVCSDDVSLTWDDVEIN